MLGIVTVSDGNGFFFVFPFFFFGSLGASTILPLIGILIFNAVIFGAFLYWSRRLLGKEQKEEYALLIEGECEFCGAPIPKESTYCPACGKSIRKKDERTS